MGFVKEVFKNYAIDPFFEILLGISVNDPQHGTSMYWVTQKLPQIFAANHANFPIKIRKITVRICLYLT